MVIVLLKQRPQTKKNCLQFEVYESGRCETLSDIQGRPWLLFTAVQSFQI